ncbi:unnamed protein product [Phaeothamnion confervicola]
MYAARITRLDVAYQVRSLARYAVTPTSAHMMAAKRVLRYLIGTPMPGLLNYRQPAATDAAGSTWLGADTPTVIREDNTAALTVAMAAGHTRQSRHIHICYHFTRELVAAGVIVVEQVSTVGQMASGLTKNVGLKRLLALRACTMG